MIRFTVLGEPKPKGSLRPIRTPQGKVFMQESGSDGLVTWRARLSAAIAPIARTMGSPSTDPVAVALHFRLKAPLKPRSSWPIAKGRNDPDKLARTVLDHLTGMLIEDDSQVVLLVVTKAYGRPGVDVVLEPVAGLSAPVLHGDQPGSWDDRTVLTTVLMQAVAPMETAGATP